MPCLIPTISINTNSSSFPPQHQMASTPILTILETSQISPPSATVGNRSLPLTFFDFTWLLFPPVHHLLFYKIPHSKAQFIETLAPNLKHSLSITLQHFFPFAGNLIVFPTPDPSGVTRKPEIQHVEGDSVALTLVECTHDFEDLIGHHPRDCDKFYPLIPQLGRATKASDYVRIPVFSVQVTFFPNSGISIGMTNHHSLCDAMTRFDFLKAWASITRLGGDQLILANGSLPLYDRVIKGLNDLEEIKLRQIRLETFNEGYQPPHLVGPVDKVRATFVLTRANIDRLKKHVKTQLPRLEYISSLSVACAYIWSCIAKSRIHAGKDELEQFIIPVGCRARLNPPIPTTYFGNCSAPCVATTKSIVLTEEDGFLSSAKLLGEALSKMVNSKDGILKDADRWEESFKGVPTKIGVSGSPKLKFYDTDFGWGKPKKYETISIDYAGSVSIDTSKHSEQDLEIGLSFPAIQMKVFATIFNNGLSMS